jgi:NADPH:quinone reductase
MLALQIDHFGPLAEHAVREIPEATLPPGSVRIQIEASGVNPSDLGVALGRFPQATVPRILGRDFAGRIVEGPPDLLGMPVWGCGGGELGLTMDGGHAERLILPIGAVVERPANLSAEAAGVVGVPFVTAYSAVVNLATFRPGERALIAGAAGAVGSCAAQLVAAMDGTTIALVRSSDDLTPLEGVPIEAVINSDAPDVIERIADVTGGAGVHVALNGVGAPVHDVLVESLAHGGRMVVFSAAAGREATFNLFTFYRKELRFFGLDTAHLDLQDTAQIIRELSPLFERGELREPIIAERYPLARAIDAYKRVEGGAQGKIVITNP